jgi:hypothetical protein
MNPIISTHTWVSLPNEVRYRIRSLFKIPHSSNTVVSDGRLESDGTTNEDLKHLTIEKMQTFLSDESTDFYKLFDKTVAKVTDELYPKTVVKVDSIDGSKSLEVAPIVTAPVVAPKKKAGRPKKNA